MELAVKKATRTLNGGPAAQGRKTLFYSLSSPLHLHPTVPPPPPTAHRHPVPCHKPQTTHSWNSKARGGRCDVGGFVVVVWVGKGANFGSLLFISAICFILCSAHKKLFSISTETRLSHLATSPQPRLCLEPSREGVPARVNGRSRAKTASTAESRRGEMARTREKQTQSECDKWKLMTMSRNWAISQYEVDRVLKGLGVGALLSVNM